MTPAAVLFYIFLVLKLTHVINWSWWVVTIPLDVQLLWNTCSAVCEEMARQRKAKFFGRRRF
jgi:hypothetical protein